MKNKLFLLLTTSLLLVGCNINKKKSSDISSEILSSQNSSQVVSSNNPTSSETPVSSEAPSSETTSSEDASSEGTTTSSESQSTSESGYGYGYYNNYYGKLTWTDGADLKQKLHDIIRTGWNKLRYDKPNWESNSYADRSKYDFEYLDVLYKSDNVKASLTQKGWQREHAFPASLMTDQLTSDAVKTLGRATDFHNLFAGDASGNSSRGNKNFGVADKTDPSYTDRTTSGGIDGYSFDPKTFEPGNKDKGEGLLY